METKLSNILIDMSIIIGNNPELWSKYNFATNEDGAAVGTWRREATCWCIVGFLQEFSREERQNSVIENEIYIFNSPSYSHIGKHAIERAEKKRYGQVTYNRF